MINQRMILYKQQLSKGKNLGIAIESEEVGGSRGFGEPEWSRGRLSSHVAESENPQMEEANCLNQNLLEEERLD